MKTRSRTLVAAHRRLAHGLPLFQGLLPIVRAGVGPDILAGLTLAAIGIPEVIGYTRIAGTPPITGLYTLLLPVIAFAIFGASRYLVVGADSATAAILAGMLIAVAPIGSPDYVSLTIAVAALVGVLLVGARILKLGFLADFLSRSALIGFLTGVGVQVASGELADLFGLAKLGGNAFAQIASVVSRLPQANGYALGFAAAILLFVLLCARLSPRIPGALLALIAAIVAGYAMDLGRYGIALLGPVPSGMPRLALPDVPLAHIDVLLSTAFACFVVILAQSEATARSYAYRHAEESDANADIVGLSAANFAASLSGSFVVNGSPTKTEIVDSAGGRSQLAHLTTAAVVLLVLLFFTTPLAHLPNVALAAIVFLIGLRLIDVRNFSALWKVQRDEFWLALATAVAVNLFSVTWGVVVAFLVSLIGFARTGYITRAHVLVRDARGHWLRRPTTSGAVAAPGVAVYRFEGELFFANSGRLMADVLGIAAHAQPPLTALVFDADEISSCDYSAALTLLQLEEELAKRSIRMIYANLCDGVTADLRRYHRGFHRKAPDSFPDVDTAVQSLA